MSNVFVSLRCSASCLTGFVSDPLVRVKWGGKR